MSSLFSPIKLGPVELSNRIVVAPMCQYSADDGSATDWHLGHLAMLANSGAGLVVVEATHVERHGRITHGCTGALFRSQRGGARARHRPLPAAAAPPSSASSWPMPAARPRRSGHGRAAARCQPDQDPWQTIAPSAIPFGAELAHAARRDEDDIARVREAFVNSAKRAVRIGFDLIELHYAHGYLAHSFLSPVANQRTDQYGGSLENRMRFGREIARAVRAVVPKTIALGARITGSDGATRTASPPTRRSPIARRSRPTGSTSSTARRAASPPTPARRRSPATTCRSPSASSARPASRPAWSA